MIMKKTKVTFNNYILNLEIIDDDVIEFVQDYIDIGQKISAIHEI